MSARGHRTGRPIALQQPAEQCAARRKPLVPTYILRRGVELSQDDRSYILRKLGRSLGKFTPLVTDRDLTVRVVEQGLDTRATAAATL